MDVAPDLLEASSHPPLEGMLSYDDTVAYEEQRPVTAETDDPRSNPLASRIGQTKIYLLSETSAAARSAKRKYGEDEEVIFDRDKRIKESEEEEEIDEGLGYRTNAILLQGTPISHLPTARLFAYAKHFDTTPLGLEWVSDTTCILVYESKSLARTAFSLLQKPPAAGSDAPVPPGVEEGEGEANDLGESESFVIAKPIPVALWPPEERINKSLGKGEGLRGVLQMRFARFDDVKKKGAKRESEFYRRHGEDAGKELFNGRDLPPAKRSRYENGGGSGGGAAVDQDMERLRLDAELDEFLKESDQEEEEESHRDRTPPEPVSKMRSDYIASDGRTLLDRFSDPVEHLGLLKDRLVAPLPRRARGDRGSGRRSHDPELEANSSSIWERAPPEGEERRRRERRGGGGEGRGSREQRRRGGRRGDDRPKKSQQELDDELDAFLRQE